MAGFFVRDPYRPLGDVWIDGEPIEHEPIDPPWGPRRAAIHLDADVRLAARGKLPIPREAISSPPGRCS